ncbi:unnamed protein product [Rodentolepis nana]|uniref:Cadherin domain-containing protein n=1 Tax=Rodentolepis nana TaxID=102285 RepID=A0A158QIR4_RODNA|nr:unnamed protein product [Rodentolepis nana]
MAASFTKVVNCDNLWRPWYIILVTCLQAYILYSGIARYIAFKEDYYDPKYGGNWNSDALNFYLSMLIIGSFFACLFLYTSITRGSNLAGEGMTLGQGMPVCFSQPPRNYPWQAHQAPLSQQEGSNAGLYATANGVLGRGNLSAGLGPAGEEDGLPQFDTWSARSALHLPPTDFFGYPIIPSMFRSVMSTGGTIATGAKEGGWTLLGNLWRHFKRQFIPTSSLMHIISAYAFFLALPVLEAQRINHHVLHFENVLGSNLNLILRASPANAMSLEYFNLLFAFAALALRYPAIFWQTNHCFAFTFSLLLVILGIQGLLEISTAEVIVKLCWNKKDLAPSLAGLCRTATSEPAETHKSIPEPTGFDDPEGLNNAKALFLSTVATFILLLLVTCVFDYGVDQFVDRLIALRRSAIFGATTQDVAPSETASIRGVGVCGLKTEGQRSRQRAVLCRRMIAVLGAVCVLAIKMPILIASGRAFEVHRHPLLLANIVATVFFFWISGSESVGTLFEVEKSGRVVLRRSLDFETWKSYTLPISVTDGDFTTETTLHVAVADVNDEAPRFEINPIHLSAEEKTAAKRLIGQVRIYDPDSVEVNGVVRCSEPAELAHRQVLLFSPDPQAHPSAGRYDLQTRIELDREGPDILPGGLALIRLICWDGNEMIHPSNKPKRKLTSTLTATLTIRDINDNPPMFQQPIYHVTLAENNPIGAKIIQVQAQDLDDGENAEITYSLLDRANFHVNPVSGWVTATVEFDREKRDSYQVSIIATDNGSQRLTGSALLNVTILDQNDNPPQLIACNKMSDPLVVLENSAPGTFIGNLIATDADTGRNGEILFRLPKKTASSASHFELRPNGTLYTSLPLDREQKATYELLVEVRDRGTPNVLSSTETVCITVLDGNDNAPHFVLPDKLYSPDDRVLDNPIRKREYNEKVSDAGTTKFPPDNGRGDLSVDPSLRVSLHEIQGQFVTRLQATDPDEGANGRVTYGLKRHAQSRTRVNRVVGDFLGVDGNTGEVWLKRALQEDDLGPHLFIVSASDQGSPESLSESKVMLVSVENIPPRSLDGGGASSSFVASANGSGESGIFANLFPMKLGERKNALILVGLISVSVILAIALVAAMICMLKPCRPFSRQSQRFFNQNQISSSNGYNSAALQAHTNVNGGIISLQEARLIDNSSVDNFGSVAQDYGYGTTLTPVDMPEGECWLGTNGKVGTYRMVNADSVSSAGEDGFNKVPQLWNKYYSLPRENLDRCNSLTSLKQKNVCGASNAAGALMTPLSEDDEKTREHTSLGHWTPMKLAFESGNNGSHTALPVTLLPAVCLRSTGENALTANSSFVSQAPTAFRPGVKLDVDVKAAEHASDSGQGGSDEDSQSQSLTQPPPLINLVQLSCEFGENPWRRAAGGESLCSEDFLRLPNSNFLSKSNNANNPEEKVIVAERLNLS